MVSDENKYDAIIIGSGMGGLTAASLLSKEGLKVLIIEQNYIPGGCTTSYSRKGYVFESGATTLVGMNEGMPLHFLLRQLSIDVPMRKLELPMQVHMKEGQVVNKYQEHGAWIEEAGRCFGDIEKQKSFWNTCFALSKKVWDMSTKQTHFPPTTYRDVLSLIENTSLDQLRMFPYAFMSVWDYLKKLGLHNHNKFIDFLNQQLLITSQNDVKQTNMLFGATALCYTNYDNYYVDGGLKELVTPLVEYLESQNGEVLFRSRVLRVVSGEDGYLIETSTGDFYSKYLVSGIPLNNTLEVFDKGLTRHKKKEFSSNKLNSAFQMGIAFRPHREYESLHHQIHIEKSLDQLKSKSLFFSLSHPLDKTRCSDSETLIASVSTHISHPAGVKVDKQVVEKEIILMLEDNEMLKRGNILYQHSSSQQSWEKWTGRKYGFVGGYPQYLKIKPWQMVDARLDDNKAYICGDTTYPGQGIPGVVLSGIIAYNKLKSDWL